MTDTYILQLKAAAAHLAAHDPVLGTVIARSALPTMRPHHEYYRSLVQSIINQQLSTKAADSIERRFLGLFGGSFPVPEAILAKSVDELRGAGLSRAKATYIRDLAAHVIDGKVRFDHLDGLSNEAISRELTDVKGIGAWTVHMFLMFCMGRLDVLPVGDLGIRGGIKKLYGLAETPSPQQVAEIAAQRQWHPYESVASWYIWQSLDNTPAV